MFNPGEIVKPKRTPEVILKCIGPLESYNLQNGKSIPTESFILTNEFPTFHYLVIVRQIKNFHFSEFNYYLTHMITHSEGFNNMKIQDSHYSNSRLTFINSFITRDVFLIQLDDIQDKEVVGRFYLGELYADFENY